MKKILFLFLLFTATANAQPYTLWGGLTATGGKTFLSLNNVENTAVSTWAGSANISTLGTIGTGTWNGTIITSAYGGTGNGFTKFSGATSSEKTYTLPDASTTILTTNAAVTVAQGGTGVATMTTAYAPVIAGTTATGALQVASTGLSTSGWVLTSTGGSSAPTFQAAPTGLTVTAITADQTAAVGNAYINNKSGSMLSITLPVTATVGQQIKVYGGTNTAFFKFVYTTNQKIHYGGNTSTTTTGNLTMGEQWDVATLTCVVANNEWVAETTGTTTLN